MAEGAEVPDGRRSERRNKRQRSGVGMTGGRVEEEGGRFHGLGATRRTAEEAEVTGDAEG